MISWYHGEHFVYWNEPAQAPSSNESLWNTIQRMDDAQVIPLHRQDEEASLMVNAALCRSSCGIESLLKMGFTVNESLKRHLPARPRLRIKPLDMVAWTAKFDDGDRESTPTLQEEDAFISNMLRERGAVRGWEYTWEYQIFCMLVRGFVPYPSRTTRNLMVFAGTVIVGTGVCIVTAWFFAKYLPDQFYPVLFDFLYKLLRGCGVVLAILIGGAELWGLILFLKEHCEEFDWSESLSRSQYLAEWFHGDCERIQTFQIFRIGILDGSLSPFSSGILGAIGRLKAATTTLFLYENRSENSSIGAW
jgi:hypothetical protein